MARPRSKTPRPLPKKTKAEIIEGRRIKKQKIVEYIALYPDAGPTEIARAIGMAPSHVAELKTEALEEKMEAEVRGVFLLGDIWPEIVKINKKR